MDIKTLTAAALTTVVMAGGASAATMVDIEADAGYIGGTSVSVGTTEEFTFTALEDLRVNDLVTVSGNGTNAGNDLRLVKFGYSGTPVNDVMRYFSEAEITVNGATAEAASTLPGFTMEEGETFTITFSYDMYNAGTGSGRNVEMDYSFTTSEIPVPAAGFLLLGGLGGLAAMRRRKKS